MILLLSTLLSTSAFADCAPVDLADTTRKASALIADANPQQAMALVEQAEANLGCLDTLASKDSLAALFQTGGKAAYDANDPNAGDRLFTAAARMAGEVPFDGTLGADAEARYQELLAFVKGQPTGTVLALSMVRVDGWDLVGGASRQVPTGGHLVQIEGAAVSSEIVGVGAENPVSVGTGTPPPPPPKRHLGRAIAGASLVVAGTASALVGGELKMTLWKYGTNNPPIAMTDGLTFGGTFSVGAGLVTLLSGSLQSTSSITPFPVFAGRF